MTVQVRPYLMKGIESVRSAYYDRITFNMYPQGLWFNGENEGIKVVK